MAKDMCCVNLRFSILYAINIFKISQVGILGWEWDWDPYNIMGDLSWMKVSCLLVLFLVFSFISIEDPPTPSINPWCARFRVSGEYFSIPMAISLIASLFFPQSLFWYIYPVIKLLPFFFPWLLNLLVCLHAMASRVPGCNIIIAATAPPSQLAAASLVIEGNHGEDDHGSEESEHGDLEANLAAHHVEMIT